MVILLRSSLCLMISSFVNYIRRVGGLFYRKFKSYYIQRTLFVRNETNDVRGSAAPAGKARERPRALSIRRVKLTDTEWNMQRILADSIFTAYMEWNNAPKTSKKQAEQKLPRILALRSEYPDSPRA